MSSRTSLYLSATPFTPLLRTDDEHGRRSKGIGSPSTTTSGEGAVPAGTGSRDGGLHRLAVSPAQRLSPLSSAPLPSISPDATFPAINLVLGQTARKRRNVDGPISLSLSSQPTLNSFSRSPFAYTTIKPTSSPPGSRSFRLEKPQKAQSRFLALPLFTFFKLLTTPPNPPFFGLAMY